MGIVDASIPEGVTFACDLHLGHMISHWKELLEDYNFWVWLGHVIGNPCPSECVEKFV
jgi:hypothetical protein